MGQNFGPHGTAELHVREIRLQTSKQYSAEKSSASFWKACAASTQSELFWQEGNAESLY